LFMCVSKCLHSSCASEQKRFICLSPSECRSLHSQYVQEKKIHANSTASKTVHHFKFSHTHTHLFHYISKDIAYTHTHLFHYISKDIAWTLILYQVNATVYGLTHPLTQNLPITGPCAKHYVLADLLSFLTCENQQCV